MDDYNYPPLAIDQAITPRDPRSLIQRLFGWTYEAIENPDPHPPWIMGGDPRERGNLVHAKDFDQHPPWSKCEERHKWGDIFYGEDREGMQDLSEANIEEYDSEEVGNKRRFCRFSMAWNTDFG